LSLLLQKKMSEELSDYYFKKDLKVRYLHSDITTLERIDILNDLRKGIFDVLVGINLLREGLDLPEVSLVAILDADKEGFLRSQRSLVQIIGRAARNVNGKVIMYADNITRSMEGAINETNRRRKLQVEHNVKNNIIPTTINKIYSNSLANIEQLKEVSNKEGGLVQLSNFKDPEHMDAEIERLRKLMREYASKLEFEKATELRNTIAKLKMLRLELG